MSDYNVRSIVDAWNDSSDGDGRKVYAEVAVEDGIVEIYGFTGNSDDAALHDFADSTEATDFAETIRRRGYIKVVDFDEIGELAVKWVLVDRVDTTGWND